MAASLDLCEKIRKLKREDPSMGYEKCGTTFNFVVNQPALIFENFVPSGSKSITTGLACCISAFTVVGRSITGQFFRVCKSCVVAMGAALATPRALEVLKNFFKHLPNNDRSLILAAMEQAGRF